MYRPNKKFDIGNKKLQLRKNSKLSLIATEKHCLQLTFKRR